MWFIDIGNLFYLLIFSVFIIVCNSFLKDKFILIRRICLPVFFIFFIFSYNRKLLVFYLVYILLNYVFAQIISYLDRLKKAIFLISIVFNVLVVILLRSEGIYKMGIPWLDVVLVVGLIYNLLKMIDLQFYAYYMSEKINLFDLVTYILFVPAFTSGPIMPYRAFNQQLYSYKEVDSISIEKFIKRIIRGLFKKIVIVKLFSYIYYSLLGLKINIFISILILMSYYILLYFDFAGYTDIAIGFGGLMGFDVPENFKKPFTSPTLTQFWRNWHATLGDWFRSHVFMPFAQFSQSRIFVGALSFMIMFLIGLWHGFNNLFILWGIYHGILLFLENVLNLTMVNKRKVKKSYFIFRCVATNTLVGFGTIFFSENIEIAKKILHGFTKLW
ncbi:hypothetical protein CLPU_8c01200 [Gottschalkia purinilytica]|uniref:Uncharacterized protein n=2 Tax=Gottschalkia purinilytica TaxID=1503 RepID=A0A0L0WAK4_GOTPU|nr:hypothetical protein CLPU_8c01200 [Gottschalkia purinilytica]